MRALRILAVDSTAVCASAAICEDEKIVAEYFLHTSLTHSVTLLPMISSVLQCAQFSLTDMDCIAVNAGPGSFTGVRIGVAVVKGLALPADIPCCGVSTLLSMAYNVRHLNTLVCAVMDARCKQVYNAMFRVCDGKVQRLTQDRALSIQELSTQCASYNEPVLLVGDGAGVCLQQPDFAGNNAVPAPEKLRYQTASSAAFAALEQIQNGGCCDAAALAPLYLRLPQAQRELEQRQALQAQKPDPVV